MTTFAHLRKTALSFPDTVERRRDSGVVEFATGDRIFAEARGDQSELFLSAADLNRFLSNHPTAERLDDQRVRVSLADLNGQQLNHWLRRAWISAAPRHLAERALAAEKAVPGTIGDLPGAIGGPATRALVAAGITTLDQVAEWRAADLRALHGIGPRAMRILEDELAATGRRFRD